MRVAVPRSFEVTTETAASVASVHSAFAIEDYWIDRLAAYGGDAMTLDSLTVDAGGTVVVITTQDLRHDVLPGPLGKVFSGDLKVVRQEIWRSTDADEVHGDVRITAFGAPASGTGTAVLAPTPVGSRLTFTGSVAVRIPLVGGSLEKYIGGQIVDEVPAVQRFTTDWIARNG